MAKTIYGASNIASTFVPATGSAVLSSSTTATTQTASDNSTKVATTEFVKTNVRLGVSTKTTSYQLSIDDEGKLIEIGHATNNLTLTIPANSSVPFPIGTQIMVVRTGDGKVNITTTDTLNSVSGNKYIANKYSGVSLVKVASTTWYLFGDLTSS